MWIGYTRQEEITSYQIPKSSGEASTQPRMRQEAEVRTLHPVPVQEFLIADLRLYLVPREAVNITDLRLFLPSRDAVNIADLRLCAEARVHKMCFGYLDRNGAVVFRSCCPVDQINRVSSPHFMSGYEQLSTVLQVFSGGQVTSQLLVKVIRYF